MRVDLFPMIVLLPLVAGCAEGSSMQSAPTLRQSTTVPAALSSQFDTQQEVMRLRAALRREVPQHPGVMTEDDDAWIGQAKAVVAGASIKIDQPQLLARPGTDWQVIGGSKVSTGQAGRRGYYITPTGVFRHTDDILDYRALGTFNENHIRGLGLKGMRVWDFGWQTAEKGWRSDREPGDIRLLMHATDPDYLERRLGRPASQGCVRIPAAMNRFLDLHGVLDADYERDARDDPRISGVLLPGREPTPLAGNTLVIVDSSLPG
jgi:hypothetical protein